MGTTFVTIDGENGFWMRDGILELWLRLLALHVEEPGDACSQREQVLAIRNQWLLASMGIFTGCVPDGLADAVSSDVGRNTTIQACNKLLKRLRTVAPTMDRHMINLLGMDGEQVADFPTEKMIEVGQAILDLIGGKRFGGPKDTDFMPGCR